MENSSNPIKNNQPRTAKSAFPIQSVNWTETMLADLYENWYRKFSDTPCNIVIFSNYFLGKKSNFSLDFKQEYKDATLIRIGCILGLDMARQNSVFANYRRRYKRSSKLNSGLCPKDKTSFLMSIDIVDSLRELLAKHNHIYIYPFQSDEDCFNDYTNYLNNLDCEIFIKNEERSLLDKQVEDLTRHRKAVLEQRARFATTTATEG